MDRDTTTNATLENAEVDAVDNTTEVTSQAVVPAETIKDKVSQAVDIVISLAPWSKASDPNQSPALNQLVKFSGWFLTGLGWGLALHRRQTGEGLLISLLGFAFPHTYLAVTSGLMVIEHYFKA